MISRSFTAISPYLRPAPDTTWASRARWYLIWTDHQKEWHVVHALKAKEIETFFPTELRTYPPSRGKTRPPREIALKPGMMFVRAELADFYLKAIGTQYLIGYERDDDDFPKPTEIPDDQMEVFIKAHKESLAEAHRRLALSKVLQGRGARSRRRSMPFKEALIELQRKMTGEA